MSIQHLTAIIFVFCCPSSRPDTSTDQRYQLGTAHPVSYTMLLSYNIHAAHHVSYVDPVKVIDGEHPSVVRLHQHQ